MRSPNSTVCTTYVLGLKHHWSGLIVPSRHLGEMSSPDIWTSDVSAPPPPLCVHSTKDYLYLLTSTQYLHSFTTHSTEYSGIEWDKITGVGGGGIIWISFEVIYLYGLPINFWFCWVKILVKVISENIPFPHPKKQLYIQYIIIWKMSE